MIPACGIFPGRFFVTIFHGGHDGGHMSESTAPASSTARYRPETRLVHSGTLRSQFGETSEALFLTQGFVYDSAEQCEARFKGEDPGFLYSRFSNPNVSMFERRMIELEGAEAARATATGMAAVTTADARAAEGRRSRGGREGDVRIVPLRGGRSAAALRHCSPRWSTASISTSGRRRCGRTPRAASWKARPIRRSTCSISAPSPRSRMRAARG